MANSTCSVFILVLRQSPASVCDISLRWGVLPFQSRRQQVCPLVFSASAGGSRFPSGLHGNRCAHLLSATVASGTASFSDQPPHEDVPTLLRAGSRCYELLAVQSFSSLGAWD